MAPGSPPQLAAALQSALALAGRLEGRDAIELALGLVRALAGADAISLWGPVEGGEPRLLAAVGRAGDQPSGEPERELARALLTGDRGGTARGARAVAWLVDATGSPAAVVLRGVDPAAAWPDEVLGAAAPGLAALMRRPSCEAPGPTAPGPLERRLARLRFDLHDGPLQDLHLLAQDMRLFREQLRPMIAGDADEGRALGRLDDLEAQLVALDAQLRQMVATAQSPPPGSGSLRDSLAQVTDAFAQRTGITPRTELSGDLTAIGGSGQIALVALIREALSNIRKHSGATSVQITVHGDREGVTVRVRDDGTGFDPAQAGARAAGRLGLVGMHERVRMLGGQTRVQSRPGGPTVITATLPPWPEQGA
jgi:signal transduction histidine kinase